MSRDYVFRVTVRKGNARGRSERLTLQDCGTLPPAKTSVAVAEELTLLVVANGLKKLLLEGAEVRKGYISSYSRMTKYGTRWRIDNLCFRLSHPQFLPA